MLDKYAFTELPLPNKLRQLYCEGEFLLSIRYYKFKVNLYLYNNFLVEVFYNHQEDQITQVSPIYPDKTRIKFYADQIKLPVDVV